MEHELPDVEDAPDLDLFLNAEVLLPQNGERLQAGKVIGRATDADGNPAGEYHSNPILNTRVYDVQFPDGMIQQYSANIIAENLYSQVDEDGRRYTMLDDIVEYSNDANAIDKDNGWITNQHGRRTRKVTTKGWELLINWKDGCQSWVALKDVKDSFPVQLAEFAVAKGIDDEPVFAWWVPHTIKKRSRIISAIKSRMLKKTHKYGIELPRSVEEAYKLDEINKNRFWRDAINKEIKNVMVAFDILGEGE